MWERRENRKNLINYRKSQRKENLLVAKGRYVRKQLMKNLKNKHLQKLKSLKTLRTDDFIFRCQHIFNGLMIENGSMEYGFMEMDFCSPQVTGRDILRLFHSGKNLSTFSRDAWTVRKFIIWTSHTMIIHMWRQKHFKRQILDLNNLCAASAPKMSR